MAHGTLSRKRKLNRKSTTSADEGAHLSASGEIQAFDNEFVTAAIEHQIADRGGLTVDDRVVFAVGRRTVKHGSAFKLPRAGVECHADVRCNHRAKKGNVLRGIRAKKDEDQGIRLAARSNGTA